jgi:hypothetical protein
VFGDKKSGSHAVIPIKNLTQLLQKTKKVHKCPKSSTIPQVFCEKADVVSEIGYLSYILGPRENLLLAV